MQHQFVSAKSDGPDTTLVRPGNWNAEHKGELYNYTFNGDFEIWGTGTTTVPTGWTITGGGATIARDGTNFKHSLYSAQLTRAGNDCRLSQDVSLIKGYGPATIWRSRSVTFGAWVRATVASRARLEIDDGVGTTLSSYHSGGSAFEWLTVTRVLNSGASQVKVSLVIDTGNTAAQIDGATLCVGIVPEGFVPCGWQGRKCVISMGNEVIQNQATTEYLGPGSKSATENQVSWLWPYKGVVRKLNVTLDAAPAGGQTFTLTFRLGEGTDTGLTCQVTSGSRLASDLANEQEVSTTQFASLRSVASATSGNRYVHATMELEEIP